MWHVCYFKQKIWAALVMVSAYWVGLCIRVIAVTEKLYNTCMVWCQSSWTVLWMYSSMAHSLVHNQSGVLQQKATLLARPRSGSPQVHVYTCTHLCSVIGTRPSTHYYTFIYICTLYIKCSNEWLVNSGLHCQSRQQNISYILWVLPNSATSQCFRHFW